MLLCANFDINIECVHIFLCDSTPVLPFCMYAIPLVAIPYFSVFIQKFTVKCLPPHAL